MKEVEDMRQDELIQIILELRRKGWTDTEIIEHLLIIEGYNK